MRGLFRWALEAQLVKADPTVGIKNPKPSRKGGYRPWTEEDVAAYEKRWPVGTRQRVWLDVLLYTGLRRGDAVDSVASTCVMVSPPLRLRRPIPKSRCQSCQCLPRHSQRDRAPT